MNLFKKVMIIGLATMALGSAAMGDGGKDKPGCNGVSDASLFQNKATAPTQDAKDVQPVNAAPAIDAAPAPATNS
jgi:hypothetical protein